MNHQTDHAADRFAELHRHIDAAAGEGRGQFQDRPCAAAGLRSYRYRTSSGWVMIGAHDNAEALTEAQRSIASKAVLEQLEVWNGSGYIAAT